MMVTLQPVAWVVGGRAEPVDDRWGGSRARIELDQRYEPQALAGLAEFSHLEVIYVFHRVEPLSIETGARRPRGNPLWPLVGIFAQRGKNRPNRLGVSVCRIVSVDNAGVEVEGLDAIDGTPVLDFKPVLRDFLPRGPHREPAWATELMKDYW
jgi:tRNA (Thr-GGU) A37 N-methylase